MYIYTLSHPLTKEIRYVGKTKHIKRRLSDHCTSNKYNCKKGKWIKSLISDGLRPLIEILDEVDEDIVNIIEAYWIAQFEHWGFNLVNKHKTIKNVNKKPKNKNKNRFNL